MCSLPSTASLLRAFAALMLAALLAACGTAPKGRDGPGANPPPALASVPDAEPRVEPVQRGGGTSKPYEVLGKSYAPITGDASFREKGLASWYGRKFHGKRTASGEPYDMYAMTAAHPTLPIPSYVRVRNPANGREVIVRVNDRGPFHAGRIIDLSYTAALKLDLLRGVAPVEIERITNEDIRTGAWRRDGATAVAQAPPAPAPSSAPPPAVVAVPAPIVTPVSTAAPAPPAPEASAASDPLASDSATPLRTMADAPQGFWVQLGAFRQREGAISFRDRVASELDWLSPVLAVFDDRSVLRLQAGPYRTRDEANSTAERIRMALQLVPVIVERR